MGKEAPEEGDEKMRMKWQPLVCGILVLGLVSCGADAPDPDPVLDEPVVTQESAAIDDQAPVEISMADGARAATDEFPFPVPQGWEELEPFTEIKVGGDMRMYASYEYTEDAPSAEATYRSLLQSSGYVVSANPLLEVTNDAAFTVEGPVNGDHYTGSVAFDTNAEGVKRANIDLHKD